MNGALWLHSWFEKVVFNLFIFNAVFAFTNKNKCNCVFALINYFPNKTCLVDRNNTSVSYFHMRKMFLIVFSHRVLSSCTVVALIINFSRPIKNRFYFFIKSKDKLFWLWDRVVSSMISQMVRDRDFYHIMSLFASHYD